MILSPNKNASLISCNEGSPNNCNFRIFSPIRLNVILYSPNLTFVHSGLPNTGRFVTGQILLSPDIKDLS